MKHLFEIVHEDESLLVVNKPAGLVCHPTKADAFSSLISRVRLHLGERAQPHMVNRLDRETSGLVLLAKNPVTALELRQIWEQRHVEKSYLAIVRGCVREASGIIEAPLGRDEDSIVAIKDKVRADGAPARTDYLVLRHFVRPEGDFSLLRVQPRTGRKHQIRIHLAHLGCPLVGDKLYGGDENLYLDFVYGRLDHAQRKELLLANHALHAAEVRFFWRGRPFAFHAEPEAPFAGFLDSVARGIINRCRGNHRDQPSLQTVYAST